MFHELCCNLHQDESFVFINATHSAHRLIYVNSSGQRFLLSVCSQVKRKRGAGNRTGRETTLFNLLKQSGNYMCRLSGVVVSVLATGPKGCWFKTRPRRWIFKVDKNPQHTFLSDGK
jgi:hypothetical protein